MKNKIIISLIVLIITMGGYFIYTNQINKKNDFELQIKCSEQSKKFFKEGERDIKDENDVYVDMINHYNNKINKCFIIINKYNNIYGYSSLLFDVNEGLNYGSYIESTKSKNIDCSILDKYCDTENERDQFVKTYMGDTYH